MVEVEVELRSQGLGGEKTMMVSDEVPGEVW